MHFPPSHICWDHPYPVLIIVSAQTFLLSLLHSSSTLSLYSQSSFPKRKEMGAGLGSCFQWIVGENPDQKKALLTVGMDRWTYGVGSGVPFTLCCFREGAPQISINQWTEWLSTSPSILWTEWAPGQRRILWGLQVNEKALKWRCRKRSLLIY
jgi:hypothetical protein